MGQAKLKVVKEQEPKLWAPRKLDIACGDRKGVGFTGIDISPDSDAEIHHDLFQFPWPIRASSVSEIKCDHFVEHIPHWLPHWNGVDGWFLFWDEVWRICRKNAKVTVLHPYAKHDRAFWDPTHVRYIHEASYGYLSKAWREREKLTHYPVTCNFEAELIEGLDLSEHVSNRSNEFQMFAKEHYWNVVPDLRVTLRAIK